ncbi:myosin-9-like isoform X2 [Frankliniella occidentalis]|uniref:Myosin-9-like isoform X2 n=1 Tax=Frankliniella occidentalis TaxID=133901 RepID=A0A9C6X9D9_FRAOC|nr:myosin-9-like isoform X2 [Frankliniella occidentalis]
MMMDSERPAAAATTSSPPDMHDHRVVNGSAGDADSDKSPAGDAVVVAEATDASPDAPPKNETVIHCILKAADAPKGEKKSVRFNAQTENYYVPAKIAIRFPVKYGSEDDEEEFVDCQVDVTNAENLENNMGNAQTSVPPGGLPAGDPVSPEKSNGLPVNGSASVGNGSPEGKNGPQVNGNGFSSQEGEVVSLDNGFFKQKDECVPLENGFTGHVAENLPVTNGSTSPECDRVLQQEVLMPTKDECVPLEEDSNCQEESIDLLDNTSNEDGGITIEGDGRLEAVHALQGETQRALENESNTVRTEDSGARGSVCENCEVMTAAQVSANDSSAVVAETVSDHDTREPNRAPPLENGTVCKGPSEQQQRFEEQVPSQPSAAEDRQLSAQRAECEVLQLQVTELGSQVTELGSQLSAKAKEASQLLVQVATLEEKAASKEVAVDKLQLELESSRRESGETKQKLEQLEATLGDLKTNNEELSQKLTEKLEQDAKDKAHGQTLESLTARVAELEKELEETRAERATLEEALAKAVAEVEAERDALDEALEEALEDTTARFQKEFEELRTVHADREQQLLADLEWKLREVQSASKKKVDEKDRTLRELLVKVTNLEEAAALAEKHAATARAETEQLRGLNIEQQRALRLNTRDMEQLQVNEKVLKEEVARLRASLDREKVHIDTILERHSAELAETEHEYQAKLEQTKKDTAEQWQTRMHAEIIRLQTDLEQSHAEDKVAALHAQARELTQDADRVKQQLQRRLETANAEVAALTSKLSEKAAQLNRELEKLQTNADRDIFELRRQLDRIDLKYQEQIESMEKRHEDEMDKARAEHERRMSACEQGYQLQSASTRATLELVKEQMRRDADASLQELAAKHRAEQEEQVQQRNRLEAQVAQLTASLDLAKEAEPKRDQLAVQVSSLQTELKQIASNHKQALHKAQEEALKNVRAKETELAEQRKQAEEERRRLRAELSKEADDRVAKVQQRVDALQAQLKGRAEDRATIEDLRRTVVAKDAALERLRAAPRPEDANAMQQLRDGVAEHKAVIDKLRASLAEREKQLQEKETILREKETMVKDRDAALRKSQSNPRPQDAQKLDELRRLLKEKDMEIHRLNNEELTSLRKKAQESEAELLKVRAEAAQVRESLVQVGELKKALGEKEDAIAKLGQQLSQRQREDSNKKLKQHAQQIEELKKALADKDSGLAKAAAEIAQLQKNATDKAAQKAMAEKDKALARLEAAREAPRPEDAARIAELQRALASKEEELGRLRESSKRPGDITEMQRALLTRDDEISRLKDAVRARHGPYEAELRRQLAEKEAAVCRLQEENRRFQAELSKDRTASGVTHGAQPAPPPTAIPVAAVQPQQQQKQAQPLQSAQYKQPPQQPPQQPPLQQQPSPQQPPPQQQQQPQPTLYKPQQQTASPQAQPPPQPQPQQPQHSQPGKAQPQKASNPEPEERKVDAACVVS